MKSCCTKFGAGTVQKAPSDFEMHEHKTLQSRTTGKKVEVGMGVHGSGLVPANPFASIAGEMHRFKAGKLHSGKGGPVVKSRKQAIAIALSEKRRAGKS